jgi:hypothetical protein
MDLRPPRRTDARPEQSAQSCRVSDIHGVVGRVGIRGASDLDGRVDAEELAGGGVFPPRP